jgi:hypothetical protein
MASSEQPTGRPARCATNITQYRAMVCCMREEVAVSGAWNGALHMSHVMEESWPLSICSPAAGEAPGSATRRRSCAIFLRLSRCRLAGTRRMAAKGSRLSRELHRLAQHPAFVGCGLAVGVVHEQQVRR